jgi:hypothetical protein
MTFVRVIGPAADPDGVVFFNPSYRGRVGRVVGRSVEGDCAGVGDTPQDPAYLVRFAAGWGASARTDLFWREELVPVRRRS